MKRIKDDEKGSSQIRYMRRNKEKKKRKASKERPGQADEGGRRENGETGWPRAS